MNISLKSLINEAEINGKNVQIYLDMDGVLVDFDNGFKKISGGVSAEDFAKVKFNGDAKLAKREFWKLISRAGAKWWESLEPLSDSMTLWSFFKEYNPIILTAGQGFGVRDGKLAWAKRHLGVNKIILADKGENKWKHVTGDQNTTHVLIDDLQKNINTWNDPTNHRIGILHTSAADSIRKFTEIYIQK